MAFCKVSSLAWEALLQVAPPKPVQVFHVDQEKAGEMRVPWLRTCSELRGGCIRGDPLQTLCITGISALPTLCTGSSSQLLGVLCQRGRRKFANLTFSLTFTLR